MTDSDADMVAKVAGGNRGGLDALKTDTQMSHSDVSLDTCSSLAHLHLSVSVSFTRNSPREST